MKTLKKTAGWLVMAAALTVGMTACSNTDSIAEEPQQQPENPAKKTYTMTVVASKGGAITRALSYNSSTKTLTATWEEGETVKVYKGSDELGTLTAQSTGTTTTLSGTLEGTVAADDVLTLKHQRALIADQDGTLTGGATSIDRTCDYAVATVTVASAEGGVITIVGGEAAFQNQLAIVRFRLQNQSGTAMAASTLLVKLGGKDIIVKPAADMSELYVAVPPVSDAEVKLYAIVNDGEKDVLYNYTRTGVSFAAGQFYAIAVKMNEGEVVTVSGTGYMTVQDGQIVTGTVNANIIVSIADGATVMLRDANITSTNSAGISCLGDATIVVAGSNRTQSTCIGYPGIKVASGSNYTLTILGNGSLTATGKSGGAGIGGIKNHSVGNIIIAGGTIKANGSSGGGAGIGSGYADTNDTACGNILIKGGTVTASATGSTYCGAGIGTGDSNTFGNHYSTCGNITITTGVTSVTANTAGNWSIGKGNSLCTCGTITIGCTLDEDGNPEGGTVYPDGITTKPYTYVP